MYYTTLPETNIAHGKSTILMVFTRKDGDFPWAMLVYQRVGGGFKNIVYFHPENWGNDSISLVHSFIKWVGSTTSWVCKNGHLKAGYMKTTWINLGNVLGIAELIGDVQNHVDKKRMSGFTHRVTSFYKGRTTS